MGFRFFPLFPFVIVAVALTGCAHTQPGELGLKSRYKPRDLLAQVCQRGSRANEIKGMVSMRVKSKEASGTFSATVQAVAPDQLRLEILQPFGGTMGIVEIHGTVYTIDVPGRPEQNRKGYNVWGGIPLNWATRLYLGRVPCPTSEQLQAGAATQITDLDELTVETRGTPREKFIYRFQDDHGVVWPNSLRWDSADGAGPIAVDFKFDEPSAELADSPRKWEAKSNRGEVKVLWRERELVR